MYDQLYAPTHSEKSQSRMLRNHFRILELITYFCYIYHLILPVYYMSNLYLRIYFSFNRKQAAHSSLLAAGLCICDIGSLQVRAWNYNASLKLRKT